MAAASWSRHAVIEALGAPLHRRRSRTASSHQGSASRSATMRAITSRATSTDAPTSACSHRTGGIAAAPDRSSCHRRMHSSTKRTFPGDPRPPSVRRHRRTRMRAACARLTDLSSADSSVDSDGADPSGGVVRSGAAVVGVDRGRWPRTPSTPGTAWKEASGSPSGNPIARSKATEDAVATGCALAGSGDKPLSLSCRRCLRRSASRCCRTIRVYGSSPSRHPSQRKNASATSSAQGTAAHGRPTLDSAVPVVARNRARTSATQGPARSRTTSGSFHPKVRQR